MAALRVRVCGFAGLAVVAQPEQGKVVHVGVKTITIGQLPLQVRKRVGADPDHVMTVAAYQVVMMRVPVHLVLHVTAPEINARDQP